MRRKVTHVLFLKYFFFCDKKARIGAVMLEPRLLLVRSKKKPLLLTRLQTINLSYQHVAGVTPVH
jgi:hypothetical protein